MFGAPPGVYSAVTAGAFHSCALTEGGEAICSLSENRVHDTPSGTYTFIKAVGLDSCGITDEGEIRCWAGGGEPIREYEFDPSRDAPPGRYKALDWLRGYACALSVEGEAVCWRSEHLWPVPPEPPPGIYTAISVGSYFPGLGGAFTTACAPADGGDIVCWQGANGPQRVDRYEGDYSAVTVRHASYCGLANNGELVGACGVLGDEAQTRYVAVDGTGGHVCAITEAGAIVCDSEGVDIHNGRHYILNLPDSVAGPYSAVSVSQRRACALRDDGGVDCWVHVENKVPPPDPSSNRYVAVSDGEGHTCALTDDGEARCWGWNNFGQAEAPPGRYKDISAGLIGTCALTETGAPLCWGKIDTRSLGTGPYTAIASWDVPCALTQEGAAVCGGPYGEPAETPPGPFVSIATSWSGSACALAESGTVSCWGRSDFGDADVPPGRYTSVDVFSDHACATSQAGEVACWGGWGPGWSSSEPLGRLVAVSTGWAATCVLTDAGDAYCSGSLGNKEIDYGTATPPPGRYMAISVGAYRACAVTEIGEIVCRGDVEYEQSPQRPDPYY